MIDATAKLQSGLFEGNIRHIGNFDECLAIRKNVGNATIRGKYCTVLVTPSKHSSNEFKKLWDVNEVGFDYWRYVRTSAIIFVDDEV